MLDTQTVDWTYSGLDLDLSIPATDSISLYMKNDINDEWERTETTIGSQIHVSRTARGKSSVNLGIFFRLLRLTKVRYLAILIMKVKIERTIT